VCATLSTSRLRRWTSWTTDRWSCWAWRWSATRSGTSRWRSSRSWPRSAPIRWRNSWTTRWRCEGAMPRTGCGLLRQAGRGKGKRETTMKIHRLARVAEAIREVASETILFELRDPRVKKVTVTRAEVSGDLQHAKVYVSIMGTEKEQKL